LTGAEPSDLALLEAWRGGDDVAGNRLVRRHFSTISRFFRNKVPDQRADLMQRTFLACVESRKAPLSDGHEGLRVLRVLDACQRSLEEAGPSGAGPAQHPRRGDAVAADVARPGGRVAGWLALGWRHRTIVCSGSSQRP
jgi:hypothetical protein